MSKIKRIINWQHVETAVLLDEAQGPAPLHYGVKVTFSSGEWINLWYETEDQAQEFFTEMRNSFMHSDPALMIIER